MTSCIFVCIKVLIGVNYFPLSFMLVVEVLVITEGHEAILIILTSCSVFQYFASFPIETSMKQNTKL